MSWTTGIRLWIIATILMLAVVGLSTTVDPETSQANSTTIKNGTKGIVLFPAIDLVQVSTALNVVLWILCVLLVKNAYHMMPQVCKYLPESCLLILVGLMIGGCLRLTSQGKTSPLVLTPELFFVYMLPPIILNTGYSVHSGLFFDHLGTILVFAVLGTIWNAIAIGLLLWATGQAGVFGLQLPFIDSLLFATIISAVDPVAVLAIFEEIHVNEILYIIVVGESVLNDAVTVVLYDLCIDFVGNDSVEVSGYFIGFVKFLLVSFGGTFIGVAFGFLTGFVTRFTNCARDIEIIYIFVMSYLSYLCAQLVNWSGILAIIFCGLTMKSYVNANISEKSQTSVKCDMQSLGNTAEAVIFLFLGVNTVLHGHVSNVPFTLVTILACLVVRTVGVVVLSAMVNRFRLHQLDLVEIFVHSYGGLRGAVAYALAEQVQSDTSVHHQLFKTTTLILIFFTVFLQGITIKPLVKYLKVRQSENRKKTMNERVHEILMGYISVGIEDVLDHVGHFKLREKFKQVDMRYIQPFLVREQQVHEPKILETHSQLATKDVLKLMHQNFPTLAMAEAESMDAFFRNFLAKRGSGRLSSGFTNVPKPTNENNENQCPGRYLDEAKLHHLEPRRRFRRSSPQDQLDASDSADSEEDASNGVVKGSERKSSGGCEPTAVDQQFPWRRRDDTPALRSECPPWAFKNEQALPSDDDYEQLSTSSYSNADSRSYFVVLNISEDYSVSAEKK